MPAFALICAGVLPIAEQLILIVRLLSAGYLFELFLIVEVITAIIGALILYWISSWIYKNVNPKGVVATIIFVLFIGSMPIFFYYCGGSPIKACTAWGIYLETFYRSDNADNLFNGESCGDFRSTL